MISPSPAPLSETTYPKASTDVVAVGEALARAYTATAMAAEMWGEGFVRIVEHDGQVTVQALHPTSVILVTQEP